MWANFYTKKQDLNIIHPQIEEWKKQIFQWEAQKVKEYFATKVVTYFDNMMIFHQKKGLHNNLMDSLGLAEKEMNEASQVFKPVIAYLIKEDQGYCFLVHGLAITSAVKDLAEELNFSFISDELGYVSDMEALRHKAWSTLVFDFELVNFSQNWINHTPLLEERSRMQAEYILYQMNFKKEEVSLVEKINFEENIKNHPQYHELLHKVMKIMPKIENSLEQEWRTKLSEKTDISGFLPSISKKKKS